MQHFSIAEEKIGWFELTSGSLARYEQLIEAENKFNLIRRYLETAVSGGDQIDIEALFAIMGDSAWYREMTEKKFKEKLQDEIND